jgi:hypothetical protein
LLCFFGRGRDESLVILIKVGENLILSYFLDLETFRVEAFFLQLLLVHVLFLLGILLPNPVNHLHSDYRLLIKYNKLLFIPILKPPNIPYTTLSNTYQNFCILRLISKTAIGLIKVVSICLFVAFLATEEDNQELVSDIYINSSFFGGCLKSIGRIACE